ncbi:MAG: YceI family protein [Candidatus Promineifilaceae bacterium]
MALYRFDLSTRMRLGAVLLLTAVILVMATACSGAVATAEATPLPQGMEFDAASQIYDLMSDSTEARFLIGEILRGDPTTVVGTTNQVSGQIALNPDNPSTAAVGPIQVDARTLVTDDGFRNRAIETRILLSRVFQYVTFIPTTINGLPDGIEIGEPVQFQLEGDLTITEYTKPVVFDVTAVLVSESRIEGKAAATIQRSDFDLFIPSATGVAGVEEDVILEMDFAAESGSETAPAE